MTVVCVPNSLDSGMDAILSRFESNDEEEEKYTVSSHLLTAGAQRRDITAHLLAVNAHLLTDGAHVLSADTERRDIGEHLLATDAACPAHLLTADAHLLTADLSRPAQAALARHGQRQDQHPARGQARDRHLAPIY